MRSARHCDSAPPTAFWSFGERTVNGRVLLPAAISLSAALPEGTGGVVQLGTMNVINEGTESQSEEEERHHEAVRLKKRARLLRAVQRNFHESSHIHKHKMLPKR